LNLVMMGTGDFAVPTFRALYGTPHRVVALYTQPDRSGAGRHHHVNPMKEVALAHGTPVCQPERVNTPEALADLREWGADLFVVAAYGQILSDELLRIPSRGAINVHASLLPKYRGAAPINYAILNGESETGVSIIEIQPQLDAGPILAVVKTPIGAAETAGELESRLAELAAPLLCRVLDEIEAGTVSRTPQDASAVSRAPKMKKEMGAIDWSRSAEEIDWHIRAMQPWPTPYTFLQLPGKPARRMVIRAVRPTELAPSGAPGAIVAVEKDRLLVQSGSRPVEILQIQPEGKRVVSAAEFLRGQHLAVGDRFGPA
jgi:methionyl-tRNA formyltransferase